MGSFNMMEFTALFLEELDEQLQIMDEEILAIERDGGGDGSVAALFRAAHTIKGSSAAMGFEPMKQLTHEMEHILDLVRKRSREVTPELVNVLFHSLDALKRLQAMYARGEAPEDWTVTAVIGSLRLFADGGEREAAGGLEQDAVGAPPPGGAYMPAAEFADGVRRVRVTLDPDCPMISSRAWMLKQKLDEYGTVRATFPALPEREEEHEAFGALVIDYYVEGVQSAEQLETLLLASMDVDSVQIMDDACVADFAEAAGSTDGSDQAPHASGEAEAAGNMPAADAAGGADKADKGEKSDKIRPATIRVNVERLEQLMNLVGELVIDQARIAQVGRKFHQRLGSDEGAQELEQISDHMSRTISNLQDHVMKVRMLPMEHLFQRFPRLIRDLSQSLGKKVEWRIEGNETELDRTLIDEISDPLIHLIRNALDHGIESADERERRGKPENGRLTITAAHEDNHVQITVSDDGAGIDPDKMKQSALGKGLITAEQARQMSADEAIRLIFYPGFSTAGTISEVSGRGVGMDIVRKHIGQLNGIIDIDTRLGEGTTFRIKLPLTLAIITGLLMRVGRQTYVMPMSNVSEIIRVSEQQIRTVSGEEVIMNRDRVIPVLRLQQYFGGTERASKKRMYHLVIVGLAERRVALVVDELVGNQEIVIKSLGSFIGRNEWYSGATILGDGSVVLIINAAGIVKLC